MAMSVPPRSAVRNIVKTAEKLTYDAITTSRGPCAAAIAAVPFVVLSSTVFPSTVSGVNSRGELPRSKPAMGRIWRSPASFTSDRSNAFARVTTSSLLSSGITARAPFARAVAIVVDARNTSMTTTTRPVASPAVRPADPKKTSTLTTQAPATNDSHAPGTWCRYRRRQSDRSASRGRGRVSSLSHLR